MIRHLAGKVGGALVSLLFVVALGFLLFRVIPGDPVVAMTRGRPVTGTSSPSCARGWAWTSRWTSSSSTT